MKHLIPYLQDDQKAADDLRQVRWPDGVKCPRCGSDAVAPRERCDNGLQRFNCVPCAVRRGQQFAMFTDWTSSIFEESKLRPLEWLLVMGLWQMNPPRSKLRGITRKGIVCETPRFLTLFPLQGNLEASSEESPD